MLGWLRSPGLQRSVTLCPPGSSRTGLGELSNTGRKERRGSDCSVGLLAIPICSLSISNHNGLCIWGVATRQIPGPCPRNFDSDSVSPATCIYSRQTRYGSSSPIPLPGSHFRVISSSRIWVGPMTCFPSLKFDQGDGI